MRRDLRILEYHPGRRFPTLRFRRSLLLPFRETVMLLQPDDFYEIFGAGGERFERMIKDLVRTEARRLGFAENDIDWDQRTNVGDGGCDIYVKKGHADTSSFLPITRTSISLKSGDDGTKSNTFKKEVEGHPTIINRLKGGESFLWCCPRPISQPKRKEFEDQAIELANQIPCDKDLFKFLWIDAMSECIARSPHLIAGHMPNVWKRLEGLTLIENWQPDDREPVRNVPNWIDFDGRNALKLEIKQHLSGKNANRLLHIAGLSGSGKTRTVIEACRDDPGLAKVVYCPAFSSPVVERMLTHLNATDGRALLIIDEVPLDEYEILARRIERIPETVRVVSIGPGKANERQREGILILAPPSSEDSVAAVAREAGGGLGENVIQSIAKFAGKDLRLALLLVEATLKTQAPQFVPLLSNSDVWKRIRALFTPDITCPDFDHHYALLTTTIDIGVGQKSKEELAYLAGHFEKQIGTMEACVQDAINTGLGSKPFDYFETTPRALAQWVFFDKAWPILKHRVDDFLENCPSPRLRKRFLDRCQELPEQEREEVMGAVRGFFSRHFGEPNLTRLSEGKDSKLFQTWAETDPRIGLDWLGRATRASTFDDLAIFNGNNSYTGGWNGRRQIVWLCEHLACFREHFYEAEDILFRLSHVETEKSISNNGTNIWKALFHPYISFTEVPFKDRLSLLKQRLSNAEGRSLELVVNAGIAMLGDGGIRSIPPAVVGGRVRPTEWKPATHSELLGCMQNGAREFLKTTISLPTERQLFVLEAIVNKIARFIDLGLLDDFRNWVSEVKPAEEILRNIRVNLDKWLSWRNAHNNENDKLDALIEEVQGWRAMLEPRSLIDRVKDLVSRDYWEHLREFSRSGKEISHEEATGEADALYRSVATELLGDINLFAEMGEWFGSTKNKSGDVLAQALANIDREGKTHLIIAQWIESGVALSTCAGYLRGLGALGIRVDQIDIALERLAETQPGDALRLTANGDFSGSGFDRVIRCLKGCKVEDLWGLRPLMTISWTEVLTEDRVLILAEELRRHQQIEDGRKVASAVAIDILHLIYWKKPVRNSTLANLILVILSDATSTSEVKSWDWVQLAKAVQPHDQKLICRLALTQLVESHGGLDDSFSEFVNECAKNEPDVAMSVLGEMFSQKDKRWVFRSLVFRELFESIGLPTVSQYLEAHPEHAVYIARHLDGPSIDAGNEIHIPEVADWVISKFSDTPEVWDEFMMGRHSFEVFSVPEGFEKAKGIAELFVDHPKPWVKKWAVAEIADMDMQIQAHQRDEDRLGRE